MAKRSEGWRGLVAFFGAIALLFVAIKIAIFGMLVFRYGIWPVITKPIYPVQWKPVIVLSNDDVMTPFETFLHYPISLVLWFLLVFLNVGWVSKWLEDR